MYARMYVCMFGRMFNLLSFVSLVSQREKNVKVELIQKGVSMAWHGMADRQTDEHGYMNDIQQIFMRSLLLLIFFLIFCI